MSWLTPLGFLGFIGLIILLIIYLIKPNYQNKYISSTFVWKLSLKYRKKRIPLSKLRNILLIICQVLIISLCAFILAQPFIDGEDADSGKEKVLILDASASMRAELEDETRYERAVNRILTHAGDTIDGGGAVTVILAGREARVVVPRADAENKEQAMRLIANLKDIDTYCTYGAGDVDGAIAMAEDVLEENPKAEVVLYTGTRYIDDGKVKVEDVGDDGEYNAAILDVRAILVENYYRLEVDMASYKRTKPVKIYLEVNGARGSFGVGDAAESFNGGTLKLEYTANLEMDVETTVTFGQNEKDDVTDLNLYAYDHIYAYVIENDAMELDNQYYLYGGTPQPLKIQYYSTQSNNFVSGMLIGLRNRLKDDWAIEIKEIKDNMDMINAGLGKEKEIELEGYDIYIFEHHIPKTLPTDGVVILMNPDALPYGFDVTLGNSMGFHGEYPLSSGDPHAVTNFVTAENITVTQYKKINAYDSEYVPILCIGDDEKMAKEPIALLKNTPDSKLVLFSFSLHYSNLALTPEYPILMQNILNYFIPTTFEENVYQLYDTVELNSRSDKLEIKGPELDETFTEFPSEIKADLPGLYTVTQTPISGSQIVESFYVPIPAEQSNINRTLDTLTNPYYPPIVEAIDLDMVFYFALAMVVLLFCEWWLKSREN